MREKEKNINSMIYLKLLNDRAKLQYIQIKQIKNVFKMILKFY